MLDFDDAGAVVELIGCVGGLGGDVADLSDEGYLLFFGGLVKGWVSNWDLVDGGRERRRAFYLGYLDVVDGEVGAWIGFLCLEHLHYGYRP